MNRPKGCISLHPHTQVLTKVPVFPMEKQLLCLPRPTICAKYSSQGIYKANKTHSSLLAEKRYSNNRLPIQHPNPGLLHRRVRSKHLTNTRPSAVARFHHKLAEVRLTPHSVIDISGPLHRFTDNVAQSPREKGPEHTEQMSVILNPTPSACEVASLIRTLEAAHPAIWQAPLHCRLIQIQLKKSLQASRDNHKTLTSLNRNAHTGLQRWLQNIATVNGSTINPPAPKLYIISDASKAG